MKQIKIKSRGFNIYSDDKDRTIYYDPFTKEAFLITKADEKKFWIYSSRFVMGFIAGYIAFHISHSLLISLFVGVATYLVMLFFFRKMFLVDLTVIDNFIKERNDPLHVRLADNFETPKIIVIVLLSFALSIGSIVNVLNQNYSTPVNILNYLLAFGAFVFGLFYIYVLIYKNRKE